MPRSSERTVGTPYGPARAVLTRAARTRAKAPRLSLVLGHGAAGGIRARDLAAVAAGLPDRGVEVVRIEQPWLVAGRRTAAPPPHLDRAWRAVIEDLRRAGELPGALVVGGRSAGARVACRTARSLGAAGVVALAFPLHPPGRQERSRLDELLDAGVPTLVVQGDRDPFGTPREFPTGVNLCPIPAADHSFRVPSSGGLSQDAALVMVVDAVAGFLGGLAGLARRGG